MAREKNKRSEAETDSLIYTLTLVAAQTADDKRADEVLVLDMRSLVDYADFFVIASADSTTRLRGIAGEVEKAMIQTGGRLLNRHGRDTGWVLLDFGDVLVHLFDNAMRGHYQLEDLWGDAPRLDWRKDKRREKA